MNTTSLLTLIAGITTLLSVWLLILTFLILKQNQFFSAFTKGVQKKDLKSVLQAIASNLKKVNVEQTTIEASIKSIIQDNRRHIQKIGFVRFNPYSDTGGNQSFVLCLLDEKDDGIMITSLHSREQTRIYAKPIVNGQTESIEFSKEEVEALKLSKKR